MCKNKLNVCTYSTVRFTLRFVNLFVKVSRVCGTRRRHGDGTMAARPRQRTKGRKRTAGAWPHWEPVIIPSDQMFPHFFFTLIWLVITLICLLSLVIGNSNVYAFLVLPALTNPSQTFLGGGLDWDLAQIFKSIWRSTHGSDPLVIPLFLFYFLQVKLFSPSMACFH